MENFIISGGDFALVRMMGGRGRGRDKCGVNNLLGQFHYAFQHMGERIGFFLNNEFEWTALKRVSQFSQSMQSFNYWDSIVLVLYYY